MDRITIADLEVSYHLGVPDSERARPQRLLLTVELGLDFTPAASTDDLTRTIDYFTLSRRLLAFGEGRSWKLIEKLAVDLTEFVFAETPAETVSVEVRKFILPETRHVSARVERRREPAKRPAPAKVMPQRLDQHIRLGARG